MANRTGGNGETVVDVRPDLRAGREPFAKIMAAAASVAVGDKLVLYATFKPVPLFAVLKGQGFESEATPLDNGEWRIDFQRVAGPANPSFGALDAGAGRAAAGVTGAGSTDGTDGDAVGADGAGAHDGVGDVGVDAAAEIRIDNRGLEPPEPMVRTLEAVHAMGHGQRVIGEYDRTPMFLLPKLEELGFIFEVDTRPNGQATVTIKHGPSGDGTTDDV